MPPPSSVVEQGRILLADEAARQVGVGSGTGVAAARMLAPALTIVARDPAREAATMRMLACWAGAFTPHLSLTPDTLLLEIGSCLRLFGGLKKLVVAAREGIETQGFAAAAAAAPTPLAAEWLARTGTAVFCRELAGMRRHLETLPIDVLPERAATALARFGAATLADVRRLPSPELARRIGAEALRLIARAFGELPDPRPDFVFPERFSLPLQLPAAVDSAAALVFAARRLTAALAGWLAARQSGVREIALCLLHEQAETRVDLEFSDLTADGERFERVLRERLERVALPAPVEALRLDASAVAALAGRSRALFDDAHAERDAVGALLERLRARLGERQVYRLAAAADHRPECATRQASLFENTRPAGETTTPRPLWLLDTPEPLAEVDGAPCRQGRLELLAGPERIESGWWDSGEATGDIRRDYFIALSADARWLWIYRDCREPWGWFLHGFFS